MSTDNTTSTNASSFLQSMPQSPIKSLYGSKMPIMQSYSPNSLNRMIYNRSALKVAHSAFVRDYGEKRALKMPPLTTSVSAPLPRKTVAFQCSSSEPVDYGYGPQSDPEDDSQEPRPNKRRRFQRRCSKTPAMLMAMSAAVLELDFLDEEEDKKEESTESTKDSDDSWDGGLEIAEELVKQLQQRRLSNASAST